MQATKEAGFTLSELLVALGVIGLIAVFTIPKILESTSTNQKTAVLKETYATLKAITKEACNDRATVDLIDYFSDRLNAVKICPNNANTEGCFTQTGTYNTQPGFILANGVTIAGFNENLVNGYGGGAGGDMHENIIVDWNGASGPNTAGDDQLRLSLVFRTPCSFTTTPYDRPCNVVPGNANGVGSTCGSWWSGGASETLYLSLFE